MRRINRKPKDQEGAIGIGTLIVFIGLILVAAIASAVIVGVMGDLQERAKRTGRETQENIAPPVRVQHAEAQTLDGSTASTLRPYVSAIEGSKGYNMENLLILVQGVDGQTGEGFTQRFVHQDKDLAQLPEVDGHFEIVRMTEDEPQTESYLGTNEIVALSITDADGLFPMGPDTELTLKFMPAEGATGTLFETITPAEYPDTGWFQLP
ncbi:MAG: hypothetical protein R6U17_01475 [Thermoplasmata archaeon]